MYIYIPLYKYIYIYIVYIDMYIFIYYIYVRVTAYIWCRSCFQRSGTASFGARPRTSCRCSGFGGASPQLGRAQ